MISRIITFVKTHKSLTLLIILVLYLGVSYSSRFTGIQPMSFSVAPSVSTSSPSFATESFGGKVADTFSGGISNSAIYPARQEYAPTPEITNRLVIQNSYLSLLVKDVVETRKKIIDHAVGSGGYMVSAETTNPQDAPTSTITVRIPSDKLDRTLEMYRGLGVKVVSENLIGNDVTDQYVDIDARVETLEKTKSAMEAILTRAEMISDLTNITQQIISIQSQIDALKGSQKSLEENSKLAKVTIYLSTDEIALPYAPSETFRPSVIFKLAVRSMVSHLRALGSFAIWVAVYAVIWVPLLIIIYFLNKKFNKSSKTA